MIHNKEIEAELFNIANNAGKKWTLLLKNPTFTRKMLKKYPLIKEVQKYLYESLPKLNTTEFDYTIQTRINWILFDRDDFPKCQVCGKSIDKWNIPNWKDDYKHTCCKECERILAQKHIEDNLMSKYGVKNVFQLPKIKQDLALKQSETQSKRIATRRKNHTFNTSKAEKNAYNRLKLVFGDEVKTQYSSDKYPFKVDFYIPSQDLYIELNYSWTHGGMRFIENDEQCKEQLTIWKQKSEQKNKTSEYYKNATITWTIRDKNKFNTAELNHLNYKVFWNETDFNTWLSLQLTTNTNSTLLIKFDAQQAQNELDFYKNYVSKPTITKGCHRNYIIKYFQQDQFFKIEKSLWSSDESIRTEITANRSKYLGIEPEKLTDLQLLEGFKKSGRFYGYSHFNPLIFNWFISRFKIKICYDPCGGWGHRLLGGLNLDKYIYNDLTLETKKNVDRIIEYFGIKNTITFNEDARTFEPPGEFEAMFTCPPYFNLEHYSCGDFKDINEYNEFLDALFQRFTITQSCKVFGLVIREDFLGKHQNYKEKFNLTVKRNSHLTGEQRSKFEYLYIYEK